MTRVINAKIQSHMINLRIVFFDCIWPPKILIIDDVKHFWKNFENLEEKWHYRELKKNVISAVF